MEPLPKYNDPTLYSLISERQTYENGFNIQIEILKEIDTGNEIKRTIKTPYDNLNGSQIKSIQERSKWNRFGLGKVDLKKMADRRPNKIAPDTFIEYNLAYLDSKHNKSVIKKMMKDPYNTEKIKLSDDICNTNKDLDKFMYNIYKSIEDEDEDDDHTAFNNYKYMIHDYENVRDDIILKPKKKKINNKDGNRKVFVPQARTTGTFVPSFRRGGRNNDDNNDNNDNNDINSQNGSFVPRHKRDRNGGNDDNENEFTVRISNLPDEPEFQDVINWLRTFDIGRFKLILPKNKKTNKNNNYGFIKYFSKEFADACIDKIHRQSYDYNIVNAEYAKPRT